MDRAAHRVMSGPQLARLLGDWRGRGPDYATLAEALRGLVLDGRLSLHVRLPSEREAARVLSTSRTTVTAAYSLLRESGHLESRRGAGSWTSLPGGGSVGATAWQRPTDGVLDLAVAAMPALDAVHEAVERACYDLPRHTVTTGYDPVGLPSLRAAVARLYERRGLPTSPDQIMVTSGALHALDLALRLLVAPGEPVVVESPSYPNALAAVQRARARIVQFGIGPHGWDGELLESTLRQVTPRLAYLIPDFQNPTGHLMDAAGRERLAAAAQRAGTHVVVDETLAQLPLPGTAMPVPVGASDRHGRIVHAGGTGKAYWGGLRVGWIRASPPLVTRLGAVRASTDTGSPVFEQLVARVLLDLPDDVLRPRREALRERRDALLGALARELPDWRVNRPTGGVSVWAELDAPVSTALCRSAAALGVRLAPGPSFGADGTLERFVRLPYALEPDDLREAVRRIAAARADLDRRPAGAPASTLVT